MVYVPPKTHSWSPMNMKKLLMQKLIVKSRNITVMGAFDCKGVSWQD